MIQSIECLEKVEINKSPWVIRALIVIFSLYSIFARDIFFTRFIIYPKNKNPWFNWMSLQNLYLLNLFQLALGFLFDYKNKFELGFHLIFVQSHFLSFKSLWSHQIWLLLLVWGNLINFSWISGEEFWNCQFERRIDRRPYRYSLRQNES